MQAPWEDVDLAGDGTSVKTSFRVSGAALTTLRHLAKASGTTMRCVVDMVALELFHPDSELRTVLDEFIARGSVGHDAHRKSQTLSAMAKTLIEKKAYELDVSRDQVFQQAILFRAAMERYSTPHGDRIILAKAELTTLLAATDLAEGRIRTLLGKRHWLSTELRGLSGALQALSGNLERADDQSHLTSENHRPPAG
jgi:hypothetical protein